MKSSNPPARPARRATAEMSETPAIAMAASRTSSGGSACPLLKLARLRRVGLNYGIKSNTATMIMMHLADYPDGDTELYRAMAELGISTPLVASQIKTLRERGFVTSLQGSQKDLRRSAFYITQRGANYVTAAKALLA